MQGKYFCLIITFCVAIFSAKAQDVEIIQVQANTSGYLGSQQSAPQMHTTQSTSSGEVIPTIKGELNVNTHGALTYNIPVEVFKGVNSFQPNLALAYSSDTGNGQAGYGWNIVGLSVITQGGKSKRIDGVYEGAQFNGDDPYYLDGQRLIQVGASTDYQTEHFSHIKVKRINSGGYTFRVQYPDGKIAKYKQVTNGQHSIALMVDSYGNQIAYNYTISNNTPYISTINYGKTTGSHPFTISFTREGRFQPIKVWRNGQTYINDKIIKEIQVSSTQDGLYRKYDLTHDITSLGHERLIVVNVQNGEGQSLKPLTFNYNNSTGQIITKTHKSNVGFNSSVNGLGDVTMGDFYGDGNISAVYVQKRESAANVLTSTKNGFSVHTGSLNYNPKLFSGKIIMSGGKMSERDQLLRLETESSTNIQVGGSYYKRNKVVFQFKDLVTNQTHSAFIHLTTGYEAEQEICGDLGYNDYDVDDISTVKVSDLLKNSLTGDSIRMDCSI